ncbi:hypothetical protein XIS1_480083 [Xenorhabdus innexi]|uniref:Uncharacterized protein n=1 Tax=Xenorhabdus innexi TaxID=290109 RepID=A0A1N6MYS5_9GAMM|nr:hypothetical protein XIS1_480083 [Xenorhabdus innexi]
MLLNDMGDNILHRVKAVYMSRLSFCVLNCVHNLHGAASARN